MTEVDVNAIESEPPSNNCVHLRVTDFGRDQIIETEHLLGLRFGYETLAKRLSFRMNSATWESFCADNTDIQRTWPACRASSKLFGYKLIVVDDLGIDPDRLYVCYDGYPSIALHRTPGSRSPYIKDMG